MSDPAALLRRDAVRAAGVHGFRALLAEALRDEAWIVRQAAAASGRALGSSAVPLLRPVLAAYAVQTLLPLGYDHIERRGSPGRLA